MGQKKDEKEPYPSKEKTYEEMNELEKRANLDELLKQRPLPDIYK
jgi:hypothetical protein